MRHFLLLFAVLSFMASCSQDSSYVEEVNGNENFTGQMMDAFSRTSLDDDNKVVWQSDDEVSIFVKTGYHQRWKLKEGAGTPSATFEYVSSHGNSTALDSHYALYPFSEEYTISDDKQVTVDLSSWANQVCQEGTFESGKSVMTAKSTSLNLPFLNANSLIRVRLAAAVPGSYSISSISLSASEALNGPGVIDLSAEKPIVTLTGTADENKSITLACTEPVLLGDEEVDFYILVPAKTYSDMAVKIIGTNEMDGTPLELPISISSSVPCNRSQITTLSKTLDDVDFSGSVERVN